MSPKKLRRIAPSQIDHPNTSGPYAIEDDLRERLFKVQHPQPPAAEDSANGAARHPADDRDDSEEDIIGDFESPHDTCAIC